MIHNKTDSTIKSNHPFRTNHFQYHFGATSSPMSRNASLHLSDDRTLRAGLITNPACRYHRYICCWLGWR